MLGFCRLHPSSSTLLRVLHVCAWDTSIVRSEPRAPTCCGRVQAWPRDSVICFVSKVAVLVNQGRKVTRIPSRETMETFRMLRALESLCRLGSARSTTMGSPSLRPLHWRSQGTFVLDGSEMSKERCEQVAVQQEEGCAAGQANERAGTSAAYIG